MISKLVFRSLLAFAFLSSVHQHARSAPVAATQAHANDTLSSHLGIKINGSTLEMGQDIWQEEPVGRGSWGILFSCLSTLVFCVWTAVHPNIIVCDVRHSRLAYKIALLALAVIVPEGILIFAIGQMVRARRLCQRVSKETRSVFREITLESKEGKKTVHDREVKISLEEAHFVIMGGFAMRKNPASKESQIQSSESSPPLREPSTTRYDTRLISLRRPLEVVANSADDNGENLILDSKGFKDCLVEENQELLMLTPEGFIDQLKTGNIRLRRSKKHTNIFKLAYTKDISDKKTTSTIAKVLAFGQVLWLFVHTVGRLAQGLPLTILEIHVIIHVVFAVVMYLSWWSKPMDVESPITIDGFTEEDKYLNYKKCENHWTTIKSKTCYDVIRELQIGGENRKKLEEDGANPRTNDADLSSTSGTNLSSTNSETLANEHHAAILGTTCVNPSSRDGSVLANENHAALSGTNGANLSSMTVADLSSTTATDPPSTNDTATSSTNGTGLSNNVALSTGILLGAEGALVCIDGALSSTTVANPSSTNDTATSSTNGTGLSNNVALSTGILLGAEGALVCIDGALHAAAWNLHFPTEIEGLLWRLASIGMVITSGAVALIALMTRYDTYLTEALRSRQFEPETACETIRFAFQTIWRGSKHCTYAKKDEDWDFEKWKGYTRPNDPKDLSWFLHHFGQAIVVFHALAMLFCLLLLLGYLVCVLYLLVESIISIRSPPKDAFKTPVWSNYWPHIS